MVEPGAYRKLAGRQHTRPTKGRNPYLPLVFSIDI